MQLHIDTQSVRQMADQLAQMTNTLNQEEVSLNGSVSRLAANWSAPGSTDFVLAAQGVIHQIAAARDEVDSLSRRVKKFVEEWETVDRQGRRPGEGHTPFSYSSAPSPSPTPDPPSTEDENSVGTTSSENTPLSVDRGHKNVDDPKSRQEREPTETQHTGIRGDNPPRYSEAAVVGGMAIGGGIAGSKLTAPAAKNAPARPTKANKSASPATSATPRPPLSTGGWVRDLEKFEQTNAAITELEQLPERGPLDDHQLRELKEEQQQLQAKFEAGIEANGRSLATNPFPEGECTWFATSKRDLYPAVYGHAKYWAEQAKQYGIEVGQIPIKGSVMVWQPGIFNAHAEFGHVSFVENVERLADGSFKIFYTDNLSPDIIQDIIFTPDTAGVDFIY